MLPMTMALTLPQLISKCTVRRNLPEVIMNCSIMPSLSHFSLPAAVPTVAFSNSPVIGALGTTVTLQFSISDDLPPVISSGIVWQFTPVGSSAMQPITSSGRYTFSDDMLSLTIGTLIAVDEGSYTLEATTIAGSDSATIFLDVQSTYLIKLQ